MTTVERIQRLEDLRPGDLMFGPIGGLVGAGVRLGELLVDGGFRVGPLNVCHVAVVVEASRKHGPGAQNKATGEYRELNADTVRTTNFLDQEWTAYPSGLITAPRLVQAMPHGAEEIEMCYSCHWTPKHAYARLVEDYPGQALDAAAIARLMVEHKVAYSFGSYPALAAWHWGIATPRLEKWIGRRQSEAVLYPSHSPWDGGAKKGVILPIEAICSVLADQSWSLTGKKIMTNVPHQCVTPSTLATRLLFGSPDLVSAWGFAAEHPYP